LGELQYLVSVRRLPIQSKCGLVALAFNLPTHHGIPAIPRLTSQFDLNRRFTTAMFDELAEVFGTPEMLRKDNKSACVRQQYFFSFRSPISFG
jgi:hypothetical protein